MGKYPPSIAPTALAALPHISFKLTDSLWWEGEAAATCWEQGNFTSRGFSSFCFPQELLSAQSFKKYGHSFRLLKHGFRGEVFCRLSRELEAGMKIVQSPTVRCAWLHFHKLPWELKFWCFRSSFISVGVLSCAVQYVPNSSTPLSGWE